MNIKNIFKGRKKYIWGVVVLVVLYVVTAPFFVLEYGKKRIYVDMAKIPDSKVAIVFGAGLRRDGSPMDVLKDRLDTAADLYEQGIVEKILVSGDNSTHDYNEPDSMYKYLTGIVGIPEDKVVRDYAGRRTYDTCARAGEVWGIEEAVLITQGYHLPRAIFTCNALGIDSVGYSATVRSYVKGAYFEFRELLAIHQAIIDVYIWHPDFVGGEPEDDFS